MTTPTDKELRALAEAATPGPWFPGHFANDLHSCNCKSVLCDGYFGAICTIHVSYTRQLDDGDNPPPDEAKANLRFIAAANPQTVLGLLDRIAGLESENADLTQDVEAYHSDALMLMNERNEAQTNATGWETQAEENAAELSATRSQLEEAREIVGGALKKIEADESTIRAFMDPEHCSPAECNMGRILLDVIKPDLRRAAALGGTE